MIELSKIKHYNSMSLLEDFWSLSICYQLMNTLFYLLEVVFPQKKKFSPKYF
jgi:hypothetical protein